MLASKLNFFYFRNKYEVFGERPRSKWRRSIHLRACVKLYGDSRHERNEVERMRHDTSLLKGDADCAILK